VWCGVAPETIKLGMDGDKACNLRQCVLIGRDLALS
jgi:hypothetical protein